MNMLKTILVIAGLGFVGQGLANDVTTISCSVHGKMDMKDNYRRGEVVKGGNDWVINGNTVKDTKGNIYYQAAEDKEESEEDGVFYAYAEDGLHTFMYYKSPETDELEVGIGTLIPNSDDQPKSVTYYQKCEIK